MTKIKLKLNKKTVLTCLIIAALAAVSLTPALNAKAQQEEFEYQPEYSFAARNENGGNWGSSISARPGDIVDFMLGYRDAAPQDDGDTAFQVNLPDGASQEQTVAGQISRSGRALGYSARVNLPGADRLEYIPDSAGWYPGELPQGGEPIAFPNGQIDENLFRSGVVLTKIDWCKEDECGVRTGTIIFKAKVIAEEPAVEEVVEEITPSPEPSAPPAITSATPTPTPPPSTAAPAPPVCPALILSKHVENLTDPNGTPTDNMALVGDTLKYIISYTNTSGSNLANAQIKDTLPSYTTFISSSENNALYDPSTNQIIWSYDATPGQMITASYTVRVDEVPADQFIISNQAALQLSNCPLIQSNETRTTVSAGEFAGEMVEAITGAGFFSNTLIALLAVLASLVTIFLARDQKRLDQWRLKWKILMAKIK